MTGLVCIGRREAVLDSEVFRMTTKDYPPLKSNPSDMISSPLINSDSLGDIWVNDNFPEIAYRFLQFATVLWWGTVYHLTSLELIL